MPTRAGPAGGRAGPRWRRRRTGGRRARAAPGDRPTARRAPRRRRRRPGGAPDRRRRPARTGSPAPRPAPAAGAPTWPGGRRAASHEPARGHRQQHRTEHVDERLEEERTLSGAAPVESTRPPLRSASAVTSATSRVLPMPGTPSTSTKEVRPAEASTHAASSTRQLRLAPDQGTGRGGRGSGLDRFDRLAAQDRELQPPGLLVGVGAQLVGQTRRQHLVGVEGRRRSSVRHQRAHQVAVGALVVGVGPSTRRSPLPGRGRSGRWRSPSLAQHVPGLPAQLDRLTPERVGPLAELLGETAVAEQVECARGRGHRQGGLASRAGGTRRPRRARPRSSRSSSIRPPSAYDAVPGTTTSSPTTRRSRLARVARLACGSWGGASGQTASASRSVDTGAPRAATSAASSTRALRVPSLGPLSSVSPRVTVSARHTPTRTATPVSIPQAARRARDMLARWATTWTPPRPARPHRRRCADDPGRRRRSATSGSGPSGSGTTRTSRCCSSTAAPVRRTSTSSRSTAYLPAAGVEYYHYDQLGSLYSDQPDDPSLWEIDRFVDEVEQVRRRARARSGELRAVRAVVGRHPRDRVRAGAPAAPQGARDLEHDGQHPGVQPVRRGGADAGDGPGRLSPRSSGSRPPARPRTRRTSALLMEHHYVHHVCRLPADEWPEPVTAGVRAHQPVDLRADAGPERARRQREARALGPHHRPATGSTYRPW